MTAENGLLKERIRALTATDPQHVFARTLNFVETVDMEHKTVHISHLPAQSGHITTSINFLKLISSKKFGILTQGNDGIFSLKPDGRWSAAILSADSASLNLASFSVDPLDNLWVGTQGSGLFRALGYGVFANYTHAGGLSRNTVWQTLYVAEDILLVATDNGIDSLNPLTSKIRHLRDASTYTLARDNDGTIWSASSIHEIVNFNPTNGEEKSYPVSYVNDILIDRTGIVWCLTDRGVYRLDPTTDIAPQLVPGLEQSSPFGVVTRDGTIWLLSGKDMYSKSPGSEFRRLGIEWPRSDFLPLTLTVKNDSEIWVGGDGGVFRVMHDGNALVSQTYFDRSALIGDIIYSVFADSRGWIWVGTNRGVAVFNGTRWAYADSSDGLAADNLSQNAISETPDGTIWIGTANGLTHVLRPDALFVQRPLHPFVDSVQAGGKPYTGAKLPYRDAPLEIHFGSLDFADEQHISFRYQLDDVDPGWVVTGQKTVRYPSLPPGTHFFTLVAFDQRTHRESAPIVVRLCMAYPMWERWEAISLYILMILIVGYGLWNWRMAISTQRIVTLERLVSAQTAQLAKQLRTDSLTGLFNRRAIQEILENVPGLAAGSRTIYIVLIDIDHFKTINDIYGHVAGDDVLVEFGRRLRETMLDGETIGRYGGEEFMGIILSMPDQIFPRLAAIREAVETKPFSISGADVRVTFSAGITALHLNEGWVQAVARADFALYRAKNNGRAHTLAMFDTIISGERGS